MISNLSIHRLISCHNTKTHRRQGSTLRRSQEYQSIPTCSKEVHGGETKSNLHEEGSKKHSPNRCDWVDLTFTVRLPTAEPFSAANTSHLDQSNFTIKLKWHAYCNAKHTCKSLLHLTSNKLAVYLLYLTCCLDYGYEDMKINLGAVLNYIYPFYRPKVLAYLK